MSKGRAKNLGKVVREGAGLDGVVKKKNRGQLPWSLKHLVEGKKKCQKHFPFSKTQTGCFKTKILMFVKRNNPLYNE